MRKKKGTGKRSGLAFIAVGVIGVLAAMAVMLPNVLTRERYRELAATFRDGGSALFAVGEEPPAYYDPIDWDSLKAQNGETVGWLKMDGTLIDYPVVQTGDNRHYMYRSFWGEYDVNGCPFLDHRAEADGRSVVVFGHHMGSTTVMFSEIYDTYKQERFDAYVGSTLYWYTPTLHEQKFVPVAANSVYKDYEPVQWFFWTPTPSQVSAVLREVAQSKVEAGMYNESIDIELPDITNYSDEDVLARIPVEAGSYDVAIASTEPTASGKVSVRYYRTGEADLKFAQKEAEEREFHRWLHDMVAESSAKRDGWEQMCADAERVLILVCCSSPWSGQPYRNLYICIQ